jgi:phytoene dehydrogenase-like protein
MTEKSIAIIGAGISGLAAGCYARMSGYRTTIFEQEAQPGGLSTCWTRQGYRINGGLAFLGGSGPGVSAHRIWQELGVVPQVRMIDYEHLIVVEGEAGKTFYFYSDLDRLERHMLELAPEDRGPIGDFIRGARVFVKYGLPTEKAPELLTAAEKLRILVTKFPLLRSVKKWGAVTHKEFAGRFKNPFLREAFLLSKALFSDDLPAAMFQMLAAWSHLRSAGYPEGGGLGLAQAIERRYLELGGEVRYNARVKRIMIEQGRAVGLRLEDGSELRSEHVVCAADLHAALFDLLEGRYLDAKTSGYFEELPVGPAVLLISLGVRRTFEDLPKSALGLIYRFKKPLLLAGQKVETLRPMIYNFDPSSAPAGKTFLRVCLPVAYDYWQALRSTPDLYRAEKEKAAAAVIEALEQRFPGISSQVEMTDVATPLTFERYAGNWRASIIGWDSTTKTFMFPIRKTLPGLRNFWLAGHWVEPGGGIPMVAVSGRNVIQLICHHDKKPFQKVTAI